MGVYELIFLAFSVSMDAFAVSICKGINAKKQIKTAFLCSIWFASFQTLMPLIGYVLGSAFEEYIDSFDHWIVFAFLLILGINMLKDSFKSESPTNNNNLSFKTMLVLSLATSIDALAVGITIALADSNIVLSLLLIFVITFIMCFIGAIIGHRFGEKHKTTATILGGIILIMLAIKILIEHLII